MREFIKAEIPIAVQKEISKPTSSGVGDTHWLAALRDMIDTTIKRHDL